MAGQKTITQRIAFAGGQEMEVQLKAIGDTGQVAFQRLKAAADNAATIGNRILPVVEAIRARLNSVADAASNVRDKFNTLGESARTVETRILAATAVVTGLAAGFTALVKSAGDSAAAVEDGAAAAGISQESYQRLKNGFIAAGGEAEAFDNLMKFLNKTLGASVTQGKELSKAQNNLRDSFVGGKISATEFVTENAKLQKNFDEQINAVNRLGINVREIISDPNSGLPAVAKAFNEFPAGPEKSALALEVFGRNGTRNLGVLNNLQAGLLKTSKIPIFSDEQVLQGKRQESALATLSLALQSVKNQVGLVFTPELTTIADAFAGSLTNLGQRLVEIAKDIEVRVRPIVADFVKLLAGEEIDPTGFVAKARDAVVAFVNDMKQAIGIIVSAWNGFVAILDMIADLINSIFGTHFTGQALAIVAVIGVLSGAFTAIGAAISAVIAIAGLLIAAFGGLDLLVIAVLAFYGGFVLVRAIINDLPGVAANAWAALMQGINGTVQNFVTLFKLIGAEWQLLWKTAGDFAKGVLDSVVGWVKDLIDKVKSAVAAITGLGSGDTGAAQQQAFASGGAVRGPGGPRTDSIWARLSNGEFVQQAAAVRHYGVDFMHAINNLRLPRLTGFADGGFVQAVQNFVPRFADGGLAQFASVPLGNAVGGRPFTLNIGGEIFSGLTAEDATFEKLQRFAVRRDLQSAGRKPLWDR